MDGGHRWITPVRLTRAFRASVASVCGGRVVCLRYVVLRDVVEPPPGGVGHPCRSLRLRGLPHLPPSPRRAGESSGSPPPAPPGGSGMDARDTDEDPPVGAGG